MKKYFLMSSLTIICLTTFAQKPSKSKGIISSTEIKVAMKPESWLNNAKAEFLTHNGVSSMKIKVADNIGQVVLKDITFKNGTIEYDIEPLSAPFPSIYFRRQNDNEQEIFYLRGRLNNINTNDAIQYAPIIDGVNLWDLYYHFQAPALYKEKEWNHVKLVISGLQMRVYINDMNKPVLEIPRLEGNTHEGSIAFDGDCIIANLVIKPNVVEGLADYEGTDLSNHDANYLRRWLISEPQLLPLGTELYGNQLPDTTNFKDKIETERRGLINLTRKFGNSTQRRVVWLKTNINAKTAQKKLLQLGFSDEIWVFINRKMVYIDKNLYQQNMRKKPDGRISIENASFTLPLKQGDNEILIGIANDFYGWGMIARLEDLEGLTIER